MPNNTQFGKHFKAATDALLDGMDTPRGPTFVAALYEANRAVQSAFPGAEKEAGRNLVDLIASAAKIYGFSVR